MTSFPREQSCAETTEKVRSPYIEWIYALSGKQQLKSFGNSCNDAQILARIRPQDALVDTMIEKLDELVVEAADVDEDRRLLVQAKRLPGEYLEHLFECAEAARKHKEGVGQLTHHGLAGVHAGGDMQLGQATVCNLEVNEHLGDDTDNTSAMQKSGFSHGPHEANVGSAVDETDVLLSEGAAKLDGGIAISGIYPVGRGTKDGNVSDHRGRLSLHQESGITWDGGL